MDDGRFLREAVRLARRALDTGSGGPFGAVVVRDGRIVGRGRNEVLRRNDPTAHAEVQAIRSACRRLGSFDLAGATLFASCEPCPMCHAAILWARIGEVVYAASRRDAARAGFDDAAFWKELALAPRGKRLRLRQAREPEAQALLRAWSAGPGRVRY